MSVDKRGDLRIIGWAVEVEWSDGKIEKLTDCDDATADCVDEWLAELEAEANSK